jgi:hypothetical protein
MRQDTKDMEDRPPTGMSEDLRPIDRAMLLALSHRQRDSTPLSLDQERLLDSWMADRLPPIDADRAVELTKRNRFAAERILEYRLISAANEGPGVPSTLSARVLRASRPPRRRAGGIFNLQWPTLIWWQWSGLGAAVAAIVVIAVFGFQFWQAQFQPRQSFQWQARLRPDQGFQIATVTIEDQNVLSVGTRQATGPEHGAKPAESYFRDVDVPTVLLQRAITSASTKEVAAYFDLMDYLLAQSNKFDYRAHILIDSKLADSLFGKPQEHKIIQIRVYDLDDPRAAIIRNKIKALPAEAHFVLLTLGQ